MRAQGKLGVKEIANATLTAAASRLCGARITILAVLGV